MMTIISLLLVSCNTFAQSPEKEAPVYVVDSLEVTANALGQITPDRIAFINIAKGTKLIQQYGSQASNGVLYIETKPFARKRVNAFLKAVSPAYDSLLRKYGNDSTFFFLINNKPITPVDEAGLLMLDKKTFRSLKIISGMEVKEEYHVKDRPVGVLISSTEE